MLIRTVKKEHKFYAVVLKPFELHGRSFKPGEMVPFDEISYLIDNMLSAQLISQPYLETKG